MTDKTSKLQPVAEFLAEDVQKFAGNDTNIVIDLPKGSKSAGVDESGDVS